MFLHISRYVDARAAEVAPQPAQLAMWAEDPGGDQQTVWQWMQPTREIQTDNPSSEEQTGSQATIHTMEGCIVIQGAPRSRCSILVPGRDGSRHFPRSPCSWGRRASSSQRSGYPGALRNADTDKCGGRGRSDDRGS